jgi:uncharacterized protein (TIGR03000 family)
MVWRHALLAMALTAVLTAEASAQVFMPGGGFGYPYGGGYPFGGSPYGAGNPFGSPGMGFGMPNVWQSAPVRAFTSSQTVVRPLLPADSPLLRDPRFRQWAEENGKFIDPPPRMLNSWQYYTPVDRGDLGGGTSAAADNRAHLQVSVPSPSAVIYLNGTQMQQTGSVRDFVTPPLQPGKDYTFNIRMQDGGRNQSQTVYVRANSRQVVDFTGTP